MNTASNYWSKVSIVGQPKGCWGWSGSKDRHGYGQLRIDGRLHNAARISWELHYGAIPDGKYVLHFCDNPECTNPHHLFLGSMQDNSRDMMQKGRGKGQFIKGRSGAKKSMCHKGHPKEPGKDCVICRRQAQKKYKQSLIALRTPSICPICGKKFPDYRKRKYCCEKCKWTASNRRRPRRVN